MSKVLIGAYTANSSLAKALSRVSAGDNFLLKNDNGCHMLSTHCCNAPPIAKSLASHVSRVVLASSG